MNHHWIRVCPDCGFTNGPHWEQPETDTCWLCEKGKYRVVRVAGGRPLHTSRPHRDSQKGFTPHYNPAFETRVESAKHMKHLQKLHGTSDFDPSPRLKERIDHARRKVTRDGRR